MGLAADKNSVHSVSKHYFAVACETSLRYHLKKLNMGELIRSNVKILLQNPLKTLKTGKSYEFAVDLTNDPYYGKTDLSNEKYVIRSQAKKSTNSFYSYISLYITDKNERFTVSVLPVEKHYSPQKVAQKKERKWKQKAVSVHLSLLLQALLQG